MRDQCTPQMPSWIWSRQGDIYGEMTDDLGSAEPFNPDPNPGIGVVDTQPLNHRIDERGMLCALQFLLL